MQQHEEVSLLVLVVVVVEMVVVEEIVVIVVIVVIEGRYIRGKVISIFGTKVLTLLLYSLMCEKPATVMAN